MNMSSDTSETRPVKGVIAEYETPTALIEACRRVRDAGFTRTDAFTPFPMHEIDEALGIKPTVLPWVALIAGAIGTATGLGMTIWMNAVDYPYIISNKPYVSLPAFIPVIFELTILLASFGAFFGMLALNGLPKFSNPIFTSPRFDRATDDRFFLMVDARDDRFTADGVRALLGDTGAGHVEDVVEDDSPTGIPKIVLLTLLLLGILSLVPPLLVARMRVTNSSEPRFHVFFDMDFTPAKKTQRETSLFADGRVMRPFVPGTVRRGDLILDEDFLTGVDVERLAAIDPRAAERLVMLVQQEGDAAAPGSDAAAVPGGDAAAAEEGDAAAADPAAAQAEDTTPWLEEIPLDVDRAFVEHGQEQFNIYCSVCHGLDGAGRGLVARRAAEIAATYWIQPSSLHQDYLYEMPDGKIYNTITHGIRKMPSYGKQIPPRSRWAIVAYVRALQRSQNAELEDVPPAQRAALQRELDKPMPQREPAEGSAAEQQAREMAAIAAEEGGEAPENVSRALELGPETGTGRQQETRDPVSGNRRDASTPPVGSEGAAQPTESEPGEPAVAPDADGAPADDDAAGADAAASGGQGGDAEQAESDAAESQAEAGDQEAAEETPVVTEVD